MPHRTFSPRELNHLRKYRFTGNLNDSGEAPVEYLTGHAEFYGLDFLVNPDVLIPRIESEKIIDLAAEYISSLAENRHLVIADIGTGSGCLGITMAKKLTDSSFDSFILFCSDTSPGALKLAKLNSRRVLPDNLKHLEFIQSNLFESFPPRLKFDLVLANLPYIPSDRIPSLPASVRDYEPNKALDGGPEGTRVINKFLTQVPEFLNSQFLLILEIDSAQKLADFPLPPISRGKIIKDIFDRPRFLVISKNR